MLALPLFLVVLACAGWMFAIWTLSSREGSDLPAAGLWPLFANLGHAFLFGILALLLAAGRLRPVAPGRWPELGRRRTVEILAAVGAYGLADEWHQSLVAGRGPSALDVGTDLVGASCVLWIIAYLGRENAGGGGLYARLLACIGACLAAASLGTALPGW